MIILTLNYFDPFIYASFFIGIIILNLNYYMVEVYPIHEPIYYFSYFDPFIYKME